LKIPATIFLLVLMLSVQSPVGQLFKIPLLIEHFNKHQKQQGLSFIEFLCDHYSSGHNDEDLQEDEQLPFKTLNLYPAGYAIVPGGIKTSACIRVPADKKIIFIDAYAPQQHLARIFHPPRL
jgi:hypothetical protein